MDADELLAKAGAGDKEENLYCCFMA